MRIRELVEVKAVPLLKHCPFCGEKTEVRLWKDKKHEFYQVACGRCCARSSVTGKPEMCVKRWNTRYIRGSGEIMPAKKQDKRCGTCGMCKWWAHGNGINVPLGWYCELGRKMRCGLHKCESFEPRRAQPKERKAG